MAGRKTASVARLEEVDAQLDDYNGPAIVGQFHDVFYLDHTSKCRIRITGMELCRWDAIPETLWRGEVCTNVEHFQKGHAEYFDDPEDDYEFVAYYFELISRFG